MDLVPEVLVQYLVEGRYVVLFLVVDVALVVDASPDAALEYVRRSSFRMYYSAAASLFSIT